MKKIRRRLSEKFQQQYLISQSRNRILGVLLVCIAKFKCGAPFFWAIHKKKDFAKKTDKYRKLRVYAFPFVKCIFEDIV